MDPHPTPPVDAVALLRGLRDTVIVLDEVGTITWVNEAWRRFAEENGADAATTAGVGRSYLDACRSDPEAQVVLAGIEDVLAGRTAVFEHRYRCHAPAQQRRFLLRGSRPPGVGAPGGAVLVHRDVTDCVLAVERLAVQGAVAQALAAGAPVLEVCRTLGDEVCRRLEWDAWDLWGCDSGSTPRLLDVRAVAAGLEPLVRATEAMEFAPGVGLAGRVWNDRRAQWAPTFSTDRAFPRAAAARSCGVTSAFAVPLVSGGEAFLLLSFFSRRPRHEEPASLQLLTAIGAQIAEVARRQRAEAAVRDAHDEVAASRARLQALFDAAPSHIVEVDRRGVVRSINRTRLRPREQVIGSSWLLAVPEHERDRLAAVLERVITSDAPASFEIELPMPDGSIGVYHSQVGPLRAPGSGGTHDVIGAIIVSQEITAERRLQHELDAARRLATTGMLAAGVAHEINNPLSSVLTNVAHARTLLGRDGGPQHEAAEALDDARAGAERIRDIAKDLKTLARPAGDVATPVDAQGVFESALRLASHELRLCARVVRRFDAVPPVLAAEGRLVQVLLNLLINAAQAMVASAAAGNEICVATRVAADGLVCLEVADNGPGITDDVKRKLFTPFFTTKGAGVGTGLGLAVCDTIVRGFGGRIEVESTPGHGAVFRVLVPAARAEARAPAPQAAEGRAEQGRSLLVIDDEPVIGSSIARALSEHRVRSTTDARQALALVEGGERYHVILCDVQMPAMDAAAFVDALRARVPGEVQRVVLITAGGLSGRLERWLQAVGLPVMEKPFTPRQLRELVATAPALVS